MSTISIEILLFAGASDAVGARQTTVEFARGGTVLELATRLISQHPELERLAGLSRWAVDGEFVDNEYRLEDSIQLAMIPPVSGG